MVKMVCVICGKEYDAPSVKGRYCSAYCRNRRKKSHGKRKYEQRVCSYCGREYTIRADALNKYCSYECYWDSMVKKETPINKGGYVMERQRRKNHKFQHRVIMEKHLGRPLTKDEIIHHIDYNKKNNDISNLMVMTRAEHNALHAKERREAARP